MNNTMDAQKAKELAQQSFNVLLQTGRMAALPYDAHMERERAAENLKLYIENSEVVAKQDAEVSKGV